MNDDGLADVFLDDVCSVVASFPGRLSCRRAIHIVAERIGADTRTARQVIHTLVAAGRLRYVNDCGVSFLEKNFIGSHRISPHVIVSTIPPPEEAPSGEHQNVVVRLMPGFSFGDCRHPTTRLSIKALDAVIHEHGAEADLNAALDIGTGSGILALTAARLGVRQVMATDIDQCARKEARENIARNDLSHAVQVLDMPIPAQPETFSIIMANLRPPTLKSLAARISEKTHNNGFVVLSGMKTEEVAGVVDAFCNGFQCVQKEEEASWCGLVLKKRKEVCYDV